MVFCVIALIVFAVLSLFSVKYRPLAKEAFECVFRKATFRKCRSGLDKRIKSQLTGTIMKRSPKAAKIIYKNFEIISFIFTVILIASLVYTVYAGYNFIQYGNCNGPASNGFCIFDPLAKEEVSTCGDETKQVELNAPLDITGYKTFGNTNSNVKFVMFGCFTCPYTKEASKAVFDIYNDYKDKVEFVFIDFPIPVHNNSFIAAEAAQCAYSLNNNAYFEYAKLLYNSNELSNDLFLNYAKQTGIDIRKFESCLNNNTFKSFIEKGQNLGKTSGVYGTPTFFINEQSIVGPKPYKAFKKVIENELKK